MTDTTAESVQKLLDAGRELAAPIPNPKGGISVPIPDRWNLVHLPPSDEELTHTKQKVAILDTASFVSYVNRFKSPATAIFADVRGPKIAALIDYHSPEKPDYLHHAVLFQPPWSEQWARWREIDNKRLGQVDFAEFIEENIADFVQPEGGVFLDIVTGLQAKKKVSFDSGVRLHDGSNQISYQEEVEGKGRGNITIPSDFSIGAPVFFGGEGYRIRCLLRYRIDDGKLFFVVKINRRLFVEQSAFADITKAIGEQTGIPVINGSV